jgi:hypothetical protein
MSCTYTLLFSVVSRMHYFLDMHVNTLYVCAYRAHTLILYRVTYLPVNCVDYLSYNKLWNLLLIYCDMICVFFHLYYPMNSFMRWLR